MNIVTLTDLGKAVLKACTVRFAEELPCPTCYGSGKTGTSSCATCSGSGWWDTWS